MANSGGEYQVFLNFCGPDTRRGFTNSLYHALKDAGIRVFIDDKELPRGERFSSNLLQAIDDSKLYITIFSPNYASHHWCLRELAKMVDNISKPEEDGNKKVILPIFYNVKPDDVKLKTDLYSNAILELEQKMEDQKKKFSKEEVETWRGALKNVDAIQGWELEKHEGDGHLSKLVVDEVVNRLRTRQREVTKDLVGMEDRISAINDLLNNDAGGVRLIGIYGMGGMGKTTLAQIIYNQLCPHFGKSCSFLRDVRETAKTVGLVKLQEQLLSDISVARNIRDDDDGIKAIEGTICSKKVLVVLDDVDDGNQIRKLIGTTSLCPGTRILVTTRDSGVLNIRGLKYKFKPYELERLSDEHALQLFSKHAFDVDSPLEGYDALSKDIVHTVGGLPLALQAIGALLFGQRNKKIWEEMRQKLKKTLNKDVLEQLKISYDALETDQKQIFLDIACFFIGQKKKTEQIFVWDNCGLSSEHAIDVLTRRCMIKVVDDLDDKRFWMHDQFRDLGRAIAKEEGTRLWDTTDISCELSSIEKKQKVQALCLHERCYWDVPCITVTAKEIKRFPNLQFLWLSSVNLQGDFASCLSKLKWFYLWHHTGGNDDQALMLTNLHLENVVLLHTYGYEWTEDAIKSLIKVVEGIDKLECLEYLGISDCRSVERIFESSSSKIPKECKIQIHDLGQLPSSGDGGSFITWECYRQMILKAQTQAADSTIETTFPEIGDPLLEQQDDGDKDDDDKTMTGMTMTMTMCMRTMRTMTVRMMRSAMCIRLVGLRRFVMRTRTMMMTARMMRTIIRMRFYGHLIGLHRFIL